MKAAAIEYEKNRVDVKNNHFQNIQDYGEFNDYPQSVIDIVAGSVTGKSCLQKYRKFVYGRGFADKDNYQIIVNSDGETADTLLRKIVDDYCMFNGFAVHVNRNLLGQVVSIRHIPFENIRLCNDDDPKYAGKVALHEDWGNRKHRLRSTKNKIEYIDLFTPNVEDYIELIKENEGGIVTYKGQILYYSENGAGNYPLPIFDEVLTDMVAQEAMANITYRNCKKGFLPGFVMAEIKDGFDMDNEEDKKDFEAINEELAKMQGDKNTANILHMVVPAKDQIPEVVPFRGINYDKDFEVSRMACKESIGEAFMQPKELRCEENSTGFSNDTMVQAYKVYNATTEDDRRTIEEFMVYLFKFWKGIINYNFQIEPLTYGTETILSALGDKVKDVVEIAKDKTIDVEQRKAILIGIYGIEEDMANELLLIKKGLQQ